MKACGIDLGTTNSCVHVVSKDGPRLIRDAQGNAIVPSVVYQSRDGKIVVGYAAKNRMGELHGPVATIKRKMGTDEAVELGKERKNPVEISSMILRYLKEMAESVEGESVERAVVTVPAYFAHIQRQQTDDAARAAGFKEVTTLLEPVAAALAYSIESPRELLRVFVYDLGGGTFDATVLEKDAEGGLNVLSFGGDPFLGGDDFDARLVKLLLTKLTAKNYRLNLNLEVAEDFSRYQRLKFFAETAKIGLTENESISLVRQGLFTDQDGELIDLDLTLTREELESCTQDLVERSIVESLLTLEKKQIDPASIDEVIMVGGMSRMPLVQRRLREAFGRDPKLVDPDLIVSKGAAIKAAQLYPDRLRGKGSLTVDLRYDKRTDNAHTRISGVLNQPLNQAVVYLMQGNDEFSEELNCKDRFIFDNVPLNEDCENHFTLTIEDADGTAIFGDEIHIVHDRKSTTVLISPGSVVTKPIAVRTVGGSQVLFPENTALPHFASMILETADQGGMIRLPIMEADHEVQTLTIRDIPTDLPIGTELRIDVSIQADYHITAHATIPSIKRDVGITFRIEPVHTSSLTEEYIRGRMAELEQEAEKAAAECRRATEVQKFRVEFKNLYTNIDVELSEAEPNKLKIREKLVAIDELIHKISEKEDEIEMPVMTFEEFGERLTELETGAIESGHSKLPEVRPRIEQLRREGEEAWRAKDRVGWLRATNQVDSIVRALLPELNPEEWVELMTGFMVGVQLQEVERITGHTNRIAAIEEEAMTIFGKMKTGRIQAEVAIEQLRQLYNKRVAPLRQENGLDPGDLDSAKSKGTGLAKAKAQA